MSYTSHHDRHCPGGRCATGHLYAVRRAEEQRTFNAQQVTINERFTAAIERLDATQARIETLLARLMRPEPNGPEDQHPTARLSITDAARVTGVSRVTLYRAIKAGKLRQQPDGTVDAADLSSGGFSFHLKTLEGHTHQPHTATPLGPVTPSASATSPCWNRK